VWCGLGVVLAFYRHWGSAEEGLSGGGANGGVNVFNAIEDGEVKGRVKEEVWMVGQVKARGSQSRHGAGRHRVSSVAGFSGAPLDRER
jgi:hypothetical protein